jgi:aerobic-type carbon monoxide dehydrogenase small subunit (CoxS/CutS family)
VSDEACTVNGLRQPVPAQWRGSRLLDFLREGLGATGAKEGCSEGECGACTVLIDGEPMCSCLVITDTVAGRDIVTVEGVDPALLERLDAAVDAHGGVQCGFCTPGFTVMTQWLSAGGAGAQLTAAGVPAALEGNLCRCTGYLQLHRAIATAAGAAPDGGGHDDDR